MPRNGPIIVLIWTIFYSTLKRKRYTNIEFTKTWYMKVILFIDRFSEVVYKFCSNVNKVLIQLDEGGMVRNLLAIRKRASYGILF
jgi:hypothetical protein